jgi:flagellar hook assembly protein FlgD
MGAFEYGAPAVTGIGDPGPGAGLTLSARPNPTRSRSVIRFSLPAAERVSLAVYDIQGRRIATVFQGTLGAGDHRTAWDGTADTGGPAPSGVYFVRLVRDGGIARTARVVRIP